MELAKVTPSEEKIRGLVAKGANVNAINNGDSLLSKAILSLVKSREWRKADEGKLLDIKFIQLLIDLGADVNYAEPKMFNCLDDAKVIENPELFEMLLKAGVNPNIISEDACNFSLLNVVEQNLSYEEPFDERGAVEPIKKIVALLKQYGAKTTRELRPEWFADSK